MDEWKDMWTDILAYLTERQRGHPFLAILYFCTLESLVIIVVADVNPVLKCWWFICSGRHNCNSWFASKIQSYEWSFNLVYHGFWNCSKKKLFHKYNNCFAPGTSCLDSWKTYPLPLLGLGDSINLFKGRVLEVRLNIELYVPKHRKAHSLPTKKR